jgi:hypothetical protein
MIECCDLKINQVERVYAARFLNQPYRPKGFIVKCCSCKKTKIGKLLWAYMPETNENVSHSFCPQCFKIRIDIARRKDVKN